jgi:cell wall-associated NlpC family hydrolase
MGTSTAAGPDGGNLACAWSVNNILANAGIQKVGSNTNYVPSVEQALQGGRGTKIDAADAGPGDIVIWPNGHHIGIAMGNNQVANNSSSRASFSNMQALPPGCRVYRLNS